jgi:hypothetical protein
MACYVLCALFGVQVASQASFFLICRGCIFIFVLLNHQVHTTIKYKVSSNEVTVLSIIPPCFTHRNDLYPKHSLQ